MSRQNEIENYARLRGSELFASAQTPIVANRCRLRSAHAPHAHDHDFLEIVFIAGGRGTHCSIGGEQEIGAGDAFILRPGAWHDYRNCRDLDVLNCCFGASLARELAPLERDPALHYLLWGGPLALERRGLIALHLEQSALRECRRHWNALFRATRYEENANANRKNWVTKEANPSRATSSGANASTMNAPIANAGGANEDASTAAVNMVGAHAEKVAYLLLLISRLARSLGAEHRATMERAARLHPAAPEAARLMREDLTRAWTLDDLALSLHLDRFYLARVFKRDMGLSPIAFLARLRAEHAATQLLRTDLPIGDIAIECGWSDPNYFARRFKAHFGQSAGEYRAHFSRGR